MKLIFATQNQHKRNEVQAVLGNHVNVLSLADLQFNEDLSETHATLEENALEKAMFIARKFSMNCFSEDSGLEIEALNGAPGVFSARYAGDEKKPDENMQLVLRNLKDNSNRNAQFRTIVCLLLDNVPYFFEGIVRGKIAQEQSGISGFGYDPIFIPEGHDTSFASMSSEQKNAISHRSIAIEKMKLFLENRTP